MEKLVLDKMNKFLFHNNMISIVARPTYWSRARYHGQQAYLQRVSTRIRGEEVAEHLGFKLNPQVREIDEVCIFIKPRHLTSVKDGDYVDVLDDVRVIPRLKERPKVKVIAISEVHYNYLKKELSNEITLIPHHHINFERSKRRKNKTLTGGIIGTPSHMVHDITKKIKDGLAEVGIEFTTCFDFKTRQDMVEYYKKIDFLVIWYLDIYKRDSFYRHPAKIINAASFGIPSLGQPILGYSEVEGLYIPIESVEDIMREAQRLKDENYYNQWSHKLLKEAEKYHISNISKLYQKL